MKKLIFLLCFMLTGVLVEAQTSQHYQWGFPGDPGYSLSVPIQVVTPQVSLSTTPVPVKYDVIDFGSNYRKTESSENSFYTILNPSLPGYSPLPAGYIQTSGNYTYIYITNSYGMVDPFPYVVVKQPH
jgi:hypothetical protein